MLVAAPRLPFRLLERDDAVLVPSPAWQDTALRLEAPPRRLINRLTGESIELESNRLSLERLCLALPFALLTRQD